MRLRTKLLLFAVVIALIPIAVAGRTLIRITEGELKTFTNQEVVLTSEQLAGEIAQQVVDAIAPKYCKVTLRQQVRGGLQLTAVAEVGG